MGWKWFRMTRLVIVLVFTMALMVSCSEKKTAPRLLSATYAPDEIVVRITSTGVQVTDPNGSEEDLQIIRVNSEDPIGSLAAQLQRTQGGIKLLSGGTALIISFETNPLCTCYYMGSRWWCRPRGCAS